MDSLHQAGWAVRSQVSGEVSRVYSAASAFSSDLLVEAVAVCQVQLAVCLWPLPGVQAGHTQVQMHACNLHAGALQGKFDFASEEVRQQLKAAADLRKVGGQRCMGVAATARTPL
jgi:hypothetical protein